MQKRVGGTGELSKNISAKHVQLASTADVKQKRKAGTLTKAGISQKVVFCEIPCERIRGFKQCKQEAKAFQNETVNARYSIINCTYFWYLPG